MESDRGSIFRKHSGRHLPVAIRASNDLPFEQLSRMLKKVSISEREGIVPPLSPISHDRYRAVKAQFEDVVLSHLQSLLPSATLQKLLPDPSPDEFEYQWYSLAQIDFLTYVASNNLAGMDRITGLKLIYDYLREPLYGIVTNTSSTLCRSMTLATTLAAKPIAETLFRGAIEAGDDRTVQMLLSVRELSLDQTPP